MFKFLTTETRDRMQQKILLNVHHCYIDGPVVKRKREREREGVKNSYMTDLKANE